MAGLDIRSASPLSSKSSKESLGKDTETTVASTPPKAATPTPDADMIEEVPPLLENGSKLEQLSQPLSSPPTNRRQSRTIPRLDTRKSSIAVPLPWTIDETSSPYTSKSHPSNASFAPPPRRAGYRASIDGNSASTRNEPPPLSPVATSNSSYPYSPSSPYTGSSGPHSLSTTTCHTIDLSHPPGYTQHSTHFTDHVPPDSPLYTNLSPFYSNNSYSSCLSASTSSPLSPTRRGRGILDNDPNIYLSGEGDGEEESYWDAATKWARAAGKRLSASEQTIWKMVNSMGGDDRP